MDQNDIARRTPKMSEDETVKIVSKMEEKEDSSLNDLPKMAIMAAIALVSLSSVDSKFGHNWKEVSTKMVFKKLESFQLTNLMCGDKEIRKELGFMYSRGDIKIVLDGRGEFIRISEDFKNEILSYAQ